MQLDLKRFDRPQLSEGQKEFLVKLPSWGRLIQQQSLDKARMSRIASSTGLFASIVMSEIILYSDWGTHPIAIKENNLLLLRTEDYWVGKSVNFQDNSYRSDVTWLDFAINFCDELTFFKRKLYEPLLCGRTLDEQLEKLSLLYVSGPLRGHIIREIIERYGLWEFDI